MPSAARIPTPALKDSQVRYDAFQMHRRTFFQSALSAAPLLAAQPGRKYKTAQIGAGWLGGNIMREALASGDCTAVAMADPDPNQLAKSSAVIATLSSNKPRHYREIRTARQSTESK